MRYISTRGDAPVRSFEDVLLGGLAPDGGLYVPESWPSLTDADLRTLRGRPYADVAVRVMTPFLDGTIDQTTFRRLVEDSYAGFDHAAVAPLVQLDSNLWLLELFHGPTIAFKDYALQLLGRLFDHVLTRRGQRATIVGATSGDTGSAAIEACRDRSAIDIFVLHPHGRVTEVQRRQMTTVPAANVTNIAIDGSFDDCQDLVKAMFNDPAFRAETRLSAVNSINWARIMAQTVYYVAAAVALGAPDRRVAFAVPTGNFGNVYAAYGARRMGVPIDRLVVGTNANDILDRFFKGGEMRKETVTPSLSPSMDIQVSSNFERLLFDLLDRSAASVRDSMESFRAQGAFAVPAEALDRARDLFSSHRLDDAGTLQTIARIWRESEYTLDPHSAVGVAAAAASDVPSDVALVALACAHPAKFPDAVERACGVRPPLPPRLADLMERDERMVRLPNDLAAVQAQIRQALSERAVA